MYRTSLIVLCAFFYIQLNAQEIALTFDDAPMADGPVFNGGQRTEKILAQLKDHSVSQVAFFVITGNINDKGNQRLQQYANAGHLLANHTHSHQWIHNMGLSKYCHDIQKADSILKPMKGFTAWFRYPFLDEGRSKTVRDSIRLALKELNLSNGYVTIDNYDWYLNGLLRNAVTHGQKVNYDALRNVYIEHIWNSIEFYDSLARRHLGRSPRHILLLHENDLSALYVGDLLAHLKDKGWKIISPVKAYEDPISLDVPDVLFNGQGRVAAIARAKNIATKDLVQSSEDEAYLDQLVKDRRVFE